MLPPQLSKGDHWIYKPCRGKAMSNTFEVGPYAAFETPAHSEVSPLSELG